MRYAKKKRKQLFIISVIIFMICGMALGYAAISSSIKINGTGTISANWDIMFTSIEESSSKGATTNHKEITDKLTATFDVTLEVPGSYAEYTVVLRNNGNIDAIIDQIDGITEANEQDPTGIQFQVRNMKIGDGLAAGGEKRFVVRAEIPMEETILPVGNKSLELKITVRQKNNDEEENPILIDTEEPVIKDGMIPVIFDKNGNTVKADINSQWYDYERKQWANAVSVTNGSRSSYRSAEPGTMINEDDILGYFVWIPRYRYQLWNAENGVSDEQEIKIEFERRDITKSVGSKNGEWLTHPAFTFGGIELRGIWVGKFETTGTASVPTIKPNRMSLTNLNNKETFDTIRKLSTSGDYGLSSYDSHMMKNIEWGAVAYLTQSTYGRCTNGSCTEVWINNVNTGTGATTANQWGPSITGCSGTSVSAGAKNNMTACEAGRDYKQAGVNASTTGNVTGIYDMSGGVWERTMAVVKDASGNILYSGSGFDASNMPDSKYYDLYETTGGSFDFTKGKLGDATRETIKRKNSGSSEWYDGYSYMAYNSSSWFRLGGHAINGSYAGTFHFNSGSGSGVTYCGSRVVVVS